MLSGAVLSRLKSSRRPSSRPTPPRQARRGLEMLEDRRKPSAFTAVPPADLGGQPAVLRSVPAARPGGPRNFPRESQAAMISPPVPTAVAAAGSPSQPRRLRSRRSRRASPLVSLGAG
jgi:hypothetical protein